MSKTSVEEAVDIRALCKRVDEIQAPVEFVLNGKKYYILDEEEHALFEDLESAEVGRIVEEAKAEGGEPIPFEEISKKHNFIPPDDV